MLTTGCGEAPASEEPWVPQIDVLAAPAEVEWRGQYGQYLVGSKGAIGRAPPLGDGDNVEALETPFVETLLDVRCGNGVVLIGGEGGAFARSYDDGLSWTEEPWTVTGSVGAIAMNAQGLQPDATGLKWLVATSDGAYLAGVDSEFDGWSAAPGTDGIPLTVAPDVPVGGIAVVGGPAQQLVSEPGAEWRPAASSFPGELRVMGLGSTDRRNVAGSNGQFGFFDAKSETFELFDSPTSEDLWCFFPGQLWVLAGDAGTLFYSEDKGSTWVPLDHGLEGVDFRGCGPDSPDVPTILVYGTQGAVLRLWLAPPDPSWPAGPLPYCAEV